MAKFEDMIEGVLEHEGALSDDPNDPGLVTHWGISLRWLRSLGPMIGDLDGDGEVTEDDIRGLTREQAIELYREKFWDPRYAEMPDGVASKVFDAAVNMGPSAAHRLLQEALRELGFNLAVDGVLGPMTMDAVKTADWYDLLREFRAAQSYRYARLAIANPNLQTFLRGWLRRAAA